MRRYLKTSAEAVNGHAIVTPSLIPTHTLEVLIGGLKRQRKCYRRQLRQCQKKATESAVHDLRIEARRLLALFDLLGPFLAAGRLPKAQRELKSHLDTFDELRDTQVQLASVEKLRDRFCAAGDFESFLKKRQGRLSRRTLKAANRLRNQPLAKRVAAIRSDCCKWLNRFGPGLASPILVRGLARAFGAAAKLKHQINPADTRSIHRTRIAFKRFRYMVESLAGQVPWANERLLASLRRYQKRMGDVQDAEVLRRAFDKFARKKELEARPVEQFARELLRRRQGFIVRYLASAAGLEQFWPPAHHSTRAKTGRAAPLPPRRLGRNRPLALRSLTKSRTS